jgi:hypothetical protein
MNMKTFTRLLLGVAAIAPITPACAQTTDAGVTTASQPDDQGLGEIIVTAQRREESLQKTLPMPPVRRSGPFSVPATTWSSNPTSRR